MTWTVNVAAGTEVLLALEDETGEEAWTGAVSDARLSVLAFFSTVPSGYCCRERRFVLPELLVELELYRRLIKLKRRRCLLLCVRFQNCPHPHGS